MAVNGVGLSNQPWLPVAPAFDTGEVGLWNMSGRSFSLQGTNPSPASNRLWYRLNRSLLQLRTEAADLARPDLWQAKTAASSNPTAVGATAQASSEVGTYEVGVTALAIAEKLGSGTYATTATPLGFTGSFKLNGREITVEATDTLATLADRIGQSGAGVTAKVETAAEGGFRLALTANTTGQAGALTLADTTPGTLSQLRLLTAEGQKANVLQAATDAAFTVNGKAYTSGTNAPVVFGVTLNLQETTTAPVTVSVAVKYDEEAMVDAARKFTEAYNAAAEDLGRMGRTGGRAARHEVTTVQRELLSALQGVGARVGAEEPLRLTEMGFRLGPGGTLSLDETTFRKAVETNREGVAQAFMSPGGAAEQVRQVLAPLTSRFDGYTPSLTEAPAASWVASQLFQTFSQGATPREMDLNRQAAVLQSSLTLLTRQQSGFESQLYALFNPRT